MIVVGLDQRDIDRFWEKVDKSGECWVWTAFCDDNDYGRFSLGGRKGRMESAHRVSWAIEHGEFPPPGFDTDHLCRNHPCVRPSHLEVVTHRVNCLRGIAAEVNRQRQLAVTHCPRNHEYDDSNTGRRKDGRRRCKSCDRDRARKYRARSNS